MVGRDEASGTRHTITGSSRVYRAVFVVGPWVVAAAAAVGASIGNGLSWWIPPLILVSAPVSLWVFGRMPSEIHTDDEGLTLIASQRTVRVPWEQLIEITNPNNHPMWLKWRWTNGSIVSHSHFSDRKDLFRIVERSARNLRSMPKF